MKTLPVFLLVVLLSASSWAGNPLNSLVKASLMVDMGQTFMVVDSPDHYEMNPILGKHPTKHEVVQYFGATVNAVDELPPWAQMAVLAVQIHVTYRNAKIHKGTKWYPGIFYTFNF